MINRFEMNGISWHIYKLNYGNSMLKRSDGGTAYGVTDRKTQTVYIADNLIPSFERKVLCHEICHVAMFSYNVDLSVEQEELLADLIATYGDEIIETTNKIFGKLELSA